MEGDAQAAREAAVMALMGQRIRVTLSDQRTVFGVLHCVDSNLNLIVKDGEILLPSVEPLPENVNKVWSLMIPGKHVVKVETLIETA